MDKNEIIESLRDVFVSVLEHNNFEMKSELSATDVEGWDSLSHMIIITSIEKKFNIRFKLREINKLENLGSLIDMISFKIA